MPKKFLNKKRYRKKNLNNKIVLKKRNPNLIKLRNPLGKGIPNVKRELRVMVTATADLVHTSTGAGLQFVPLTMPLNFPTMIRNSAGTYGGFANGGSIANASLSPVWQRLFGGGATVMFDEYKVMAVKFRFIPYNAQVQDSSTAYDTAAYPQLIYRYNDPDDNANLVSEAQATNGGIIPKTFSIGQSIFYSFVQPKELRQQWYNVQNYNTAEGTAVSGSTMPWPNSYASLKIGITYGATAAVAAALGRFYVQWDCIFKGIRDSQT